MVPESHLGKILFTDEIQGIGHAKQRICRKGHVSTVVAHDHAKRPTLRLGRLPLHFHQGVGVLNKVRNGAYLSNQSLALADNQPDTYAL